MQPNTLTSSSISAVISHSCIGESKYKNGSYSLKNSSHNLHLAKAGKTASFLFGTELQVIAQCTILNCHMHLSMARHSSCICNQPRGHRPGLGVQHSSSLLGWFCGRTISFGLLTNCQWYR